MDVGLLLLINFISVPFLYEAEALGVDSKEFPKIAELLRLRVTRSERWFFGYCIFLFIFSLVVIAPSASGRSHDVGVFLFFLIFLIQAFLWAFVVFRINK
jgi:hypothetical protein